MSTLRPKFDWKNGTLAPSGAVNRDIDEKLSDFISVKDFGAVGDNVTDDYASIQAAIDYAYSVDKGIYFPSGTYKVSTGLQMKVGCASAPNAVLDANSASIIVVTIPTGNYVDTYFNMPTIVRGTVGLLLQGVSLATIFVSNIALSTNGLVLEVNDTNKICADNVITFNTINGNAEAAIKFSFLATALSGTLMQGNQIKGNFITSSKYGVYFWDVNNGGLGANIPWDDTEVNVFAIDPANLIGSVGFLANASFPAARCFLSATGFFDAMDDAYIKGACVDNPIFKISPSGILDYTKFKQTGAFKIVNYASPQGQLWGVNPIPVLTTAENTISSFNGGVPLQANRNLVDVPVGTSLSSVAITGSAGQFSCSATNLVVDQPVTITGTFGGTGSISGYVSGTTYYIIATNNTTTFTLSATKGGSAITTTAGTPTGLTYAAGLGPKQHFYAYFYHVLMSQYSPKIIAEPFFEENTPMVVLFCGEKSTPGAPVPGGPNTYPFQGLLILYALDSVPAGSRYMAITVHDAPQ